MTDTAPLRIAVIGGGLSGLTTAYRLLSEAKTHGRSIDVTVLEARDRCGGMAVAFKLGGHTVEHGSHGFFGSGVGYYVNSVALTRELGTYDSLYQVPGWTLVYRDGRRWTATNSKWLPRLLDVAPSMFRIPWLTLWEKLRACWAALRLALIPYRKFRPLDQVNGYTLGRSKGYSHDGALTWNMASLGLTNQFVDASPERNDPGLSGVLYTGKHRVLLRSPQGLGYLLPSGDLSDVLANPLRARVEELGGHVHTGARVASIDREARQLTYGAAGGAATTLAFDHLVVAVQPQAAASLITWCDPPWKTLKPTSPVITMNVGLSGRLKASIDGRELGLSRRDWPFSVITDLSRTWPEYAAERTGDKTVLRVEIGHADLPPGPAPKDELLAAVKGGLDRLYPECKDLTIEWCELNHEKELLYVSWLRGEWSKQPLPAQRVVAPAVYLAGDWTSRGTIGMEAAVNSAYEAVNWIHGQHGWPLVAYTQVPLG